MTSYTWRVGDVFTDGVYRWRVDSVQGELAVMRSCGSPWATTIPLTFSEWREGGRWRLEAKAQIDREAREDFLKWECPKCREEHVLFPGREWVYDE